VRDLIASFVLAVIILFTVFNWAGVTPREWSFTLVAICLLSLFVWLSRAANALAPPLSPALSLMAAALFVYVGFQLVPMPLGWLRILSPNRFEIVQMLAPIHNQAWAPLSVSPQLTFAQLLRLLGYFLVFCLTRELGFQLQNRLWVVIAPLFLVASVESSIGLVQHFTTGDYGMGTYANHGHLAGLLEMVLPLTLIMIPICLRAKRTGIESTGSVAIVCALVACSALILIGLLYTSSRMGLAAAAVSMVVLAILALRSGGKRTYAVFVAAAALVFLLVSAPLSLVSRYEPGLTAEVRLQIWSDTLKLIAHYPVFGCGLGAFVSAVQKYRAATPLALVDYAHDDYLQLFAELGVAGFLLVTGLGVTVVRGILRTLRNESNQPARLLAMACAASLAAIAVHSLVDFQFYIPANVMVAAWIAGIAHGIGLDVDRAARMEAARPSRDGADWVDAVP